MSRTEFMNQLKNLLWDIPECEREEALNYYEDYFDDAGAENEAQIIASLGSPEKVAAIIKEGLKEDAAEQGEFSENGYSGYGEPAKEEVVYYGTQKEQKFTDKIKNPRFYKCFLPLTLITASSVLALIFNVNKVAIIIAPNIKGNTLIKITKITKNN